MAISGLKTEINVLNLKMLEIPKSTEQRQKNHSKTLIFVINDVFSSNIL